LSKIKTILSIAFVDAPATMVNAVGDNVASLLVARILGGKNWIKEA
jgi:Na+/H+-dicarboxylate symporter